MNSIKPILLVMHDYLDAPTRRSLKNAGYLVVEVKDTAGVKIITPPPLVPLMGLGAIALGVLADETIYDSDLRNTFRKRVLKTALEQMGETFPVKPKPKPPVASPAPPTAPVGSNE